MSSAQPASARLPVLHGIAATAWLTVAARARASQEPALAPAGFSDAQAVELLAKAPAEAADCARHDAFVRGVAWRSAWFDRMAVDFFSQCPDGAVVSLGAGLCTRRHRLDPMLASQHPGPGAGARIIDWLNVDQSNVTAWRDCFVPLRPGERNVAASVFDLEAWLAQLHVPPDRGLLLMLEGVCPYLEQAPLESLLQQLASSFAQHVAPVRLVLDVVHPGLLHWPQQVGSFTLPVVSGFHSAAQIAGLHPGLRVVHSEHPYPHFSPAHRQLEETIRMLRDESPYACVCLAAGAA